jgi:hypothetical protein
MCVCVCVFIIYVYMCICIYIYRVVTAAEAPHVVGDCYEVVYRLFLHMYCV